MILGNTGAEGNPSTQVRIIIPYDGNVVKTLMKLSWDEMWMVAREGLFAENKGVHSSESFFHSGGGQGQIHADVAGAVKGRPS